MQLFYIPDVKGDIVNLDQVESKHSIKVLRLTEGTRVNIIDGKGGFYEAEIIDANPKSCRLQITDSQQQFGKRNFRLHVAIAPTKNIDRLEWFLEKATEIGIDKVTPILCEHSERKVIKEDRLEKIMIAAMKQSLKAYLPVLNPMAPLEEILCAANEKHKFVAHCHAGSKIHMKETVVPGEDILVLIGPEGDFSPEEVKAAEDSGFKAVTLGNSRLRTETAGVVACHIANLVNE